MIGDPLFTVPFLVDGKREVLCYEIHGQPSQHFNLISDNCVSVAAGYVQVYSNSTEELLNVIGEVGILAVDNAGECVRISIESELCLAAVDSVPVDVIYMSQGVRVRKGRNYVRVSVPNCADSMLTMWILCRNFDNNAMIKFVVTRGINLRETSHGLIGMFIIIRSYICLTQDVLTVCAWLLMTLFQDSFGTFHTLLKTLWER